MGAPGPGASTFRDHAWDWAAPALVVALILARVRIVNQWDFEIYYFGALADRAGLSPYDADSITAAAHGPLKYLFPYMYPPLTLWLFKPFSLLSIGAAKTVWLALKLLAAVVLVRLWQRRFVPRRDWLGWVLVLALAYNSALVREVRAGNFELFIELLVWFALAAWMREQWALFCGLIISAAIFKLTPILLLGLLIFAPPPVRLRYAVGSLLAFAALLGISALSSPGDFTRWVANVSAHDEEMGMRNPCSLALFREIPDYFAPVDAVASWKRAATLAYFGFAATIGLASAWAVWRSRTAPLTSDRRLLLVGGTLVTYTLMLPRFMVYAYVLLLVPTFLILAERRAALVVFLLLFAVHDLADKLLGQPIDPGSPFWSQASPLLLLAVWLGYLVVNYGSLFFAFAVWCLYRAALSRPVDTTRSDGV